MSRSKTIELTEFYFSEAGEDVCGDVFCPWCGYRAFIKFTREYLESTQVYLNPNHDIITGGLIQYVEFLYINPEAIEYINNLKGQLCCPHCIEGELAISGDSIYNLKNILEALECHVE